MQLNYLADVSNENSMIPTPISGLCKRVLYRQSECQVCVDICPTNAISLPFGPELSGACINCGLCQIACPTEVFEGLHDTDKMFLEMLRDQDDTIIIDQKVYVHCHQAAACDAKSVPVNCLGNMTENALIAMMGADVQMLEASTGKCSDCQMFQGMGLFKQAAITYVKLSNVFSRPAITITLCEKQKISQPSPTMSRRDLFRTLGNGVAKQAAKVVVSKEQQIRALLKTDDDTTVQKRRSPRRETLKAILEETLLAENGTENFDVPACRAFPW